jgi:uncharacterized protein (TIGR00661 family)
MKILFGVQTTGNGHLTRSSVLVNQLCSLGHHVDVLMSGHISSEVFAKRLFPQGRFVEGPSLVTHSGELHLWKTLRHAKFLNFAKAVRTLSLKSYDLVLTDYEPITAWAARLHRKMSIGISNQYIMLNHSVRYPVFSPFSPLMDRFFAPAQVCLGLHWHSFGQNTLPPVLPCEQLDALNKESLDQQVVVYLPFESPTVITDFLATQPQVRFEIFHPSIEQPTMLGNLHWQPLDRDYFLQRLASSTGLIANSGFSTVSEAIYLGKPILVKPLRKQLEQMLNAEILRQTKLGSVMTHFSPIVLEHWLAQRQPLSVRQWPDVSKLLAAWISAEDYSDAALSALHQQCWLY